MTSISTIAKGEGSGISTPRRVLVRDQPGWDALWADHARATAGAPQVDFTTHMVAAVFLGDRPTPGYSVEIKDLRREDEALGLVVNEYRPAAGLLAAQMIVTPFHIVALPRFDGEVVFVDAAGARLRAEVPAPSVDVNAGIRETIPLKAEVTESVRLKADPTDIVHLKADPTDIVHLKADPTDTVLKADPPDHLKMDRTDTSPAAASMGSMSSTGLDPNFAAALAYLAGPFSGVLILLVERTNSYVRFHAWQAVVGLGGLLLLSAGMLVLSFLTLLLSPFVFTVMYRLSYLLAAVWAVLWVICLVQAFSGNRWMMPVAGRHAERLATRPV